MQMKPNVTTKSFGFFLLIATAVFIIALMIFTNNGLRDVTAARIDECGVRLEALKEDLQEAESNNATEDELKKLNNSIDAYEERITMLENREKLYAVSMCFLVFVLLIAAFLQSQKTTSFQRASLYAPSATYDYYHFLSAPLCAIGLLMAIGITYRSIFWWDATDLVFLIGAVIVGAVAFLGYRKVPYITARYNKQRLGNTRFTYGDMLFLLPAVGALLLLVINILFGVTVNGAKLWINVMGIQFQPGEVIKVLLAVLFASSYGKMWRALAAFAVSGVTMLGLLYLRDMGAAIVVFFMVVIMLFLLLDNKMTFALYEHKKLLILISVLAVCLFFVVLSFFDYARERFLNVGSAMENIKHTQQAEMLRALVFGGIGGLGLENSSYILNIFAVQNDMAIAGMTAVFGYGMLLIVLLCYALLVILPLRKHAFYREFYFVSVQISVIIVAQVALNALGAVDVLPFTGIVAPFISDGGTALVSFSAMMGILLATLHPVIKPLEVND